MFGSSRISSVFTQFNTSLQVNKMIAGVNTVDPLFLVKKSCIFIEVPGLFVEG